MYGGRRIFACVVVLAVAIGCGPKEEPPLDEANFSRRVTTRWTKICECACTGLGQPPSGVATWGPQNTDWSSDLVDRDLAFECLAAFDEGVSSCTHPFTLPGAKGPRVYWACHSAFRHGDRAQGEACGVEWHCAPPPDALRTCRSGKCDQIPLFAPTLGSICGCR